VTLPFWIALAIFFAVFLFLVWWLRPWPSDDHVPELARHGACICHICQFGTDSEGGLSDHVHAGRPTSKEWPR
jgi:hypothetical protein